MKHCMYLIVALCFPMAVFCQDITGLWKGTMVNDSTKQMLEYEIVISKEKGKFIGYSHTWFVINEKKYYGIKKINVRIAKDGKIVLQDDKLIENNYPISPYKDVMQLNVLDIADIGADKTLDGIFVTNRTKKYKELTGLINLKKANLYSQSDLMQFLQKNSSDFYLAVVK